MTIGLLSNRNLPRGLNWTLLSDSLFAEIEKLADARVIAPPRPSIGALGQYWRLNRECQRMRAVFSMHGRARPEWPLQAVSRPAWGALRAVFYVDPWAHTIDRIRRADRIFAHDISFIPYMEAYRALASEVSDTRYVYLPFASDNTVFRDRGLERDIDVLWMGRRSEALHVALLDLAAKRGLNYQYRETTGFVADPKDLGTLASRARYFVVTPPPAERSGGYSPLLMRYFEGLAAGCRLLGLRPSSGEFENLLPAASLLEVAEDGSDLMEAYDRDQTDRSGWDASRKAQALVLRDHGWDARAKTIVHHIETALAA